MFEQALKMAWRDWRSGELRLLMLAVTLAVAALCSVGFFTDRLSSTLEQEAHQLLGGDIMIVSDQSLPLEFLQEAEKHQLQTTRFATFSSMVRSPDKEVAEEQVEFGKMRLASIKAVDEHYPLLGTLKTQLALDAPLLDTAHGPDRGGVWVAPELLAALDLRVGDLLVLGETSLPITRILVIEPDGSAASLMMAPRVMLHAQDLPATELIQPASRVSYRFAASGDAQNIKLFDAWATQRIEGDASTSMPMRGIRIERLETGQPVMQQTLDRAQKFLRLVALLTTLLCAVGVVIAARDFARRHLNTCAMLRVFGVTQKKIVSFYVIEFLCVGLLAALGGIIVGYVMHHVFVILLAEVLGKTLAQISLTPAFYGLGIGVVLLLTFGLPPVLQLAQVPPLKVMRKEISDLPPMAISVFLMGSCGFMLLLAGISGDLLLGALTVGGFLIALIIFAAVAYLILKTIKLLSQAYTLPIWLRLAIRALTTHSTGILTQISALGVGLLALLLLFLLRTDLVNSWQEITPVDAPNRFVINIMPDQADAFEATLNNAHISNYDWYPMILGRLTSINDESINLDNYQDDRAKRLVDREFSLSYMAQYPAHNKIIEGRWIKDEADSISVEAGLMETLGLQLGDQLTFLIGGVEHMGRITSVRELEWSSMHVNFFVIFTHSQLTDVSQTYITAFKAPDTLTFDDQLAREYPNITVINLSAMLQQVQSILNQVIRAIEFIFIFALGAGLLVLYAAISSTREQRKHDFAVMRALGADNQLLIKTQRTELMSIGAISGAIASFLALGIAGILITFVFDFNWKPTLWTPLLGATVGLLLAWFTGWLSLGSILKTPVVETLRGVLD